MTTSSNNKVSPDSLLASIIFNCSIIEGFVFVYTYCEVAFCACRKQCSSGCDDVSTLTTTCEPDVCATLRRTTPRRATQRSAATRCVTPAPRRAGVNLPSNVNTFPNFRLAISQHHIMVNVNSSKLNHRYIFHYQASLRSDKTASTV